MMRVLNLKSMALSSESAALRWIDVEADEAIYWNAIPLCTTVTVTTLKAKFVS